MRFEPPAVVAAVLPVVLAVAVLAGCTSVPPAAGSGSNSSLTLAQSPSASPSSTRSATMTPTPSASVRSGVVGGPTLRTGCLRTVAIGLSVQRRAITACERGVRGGAALVVIGTIHGHETLGLGVIADLLKAPVQGRGPTPAVARCPSRRRPRSADSSPASGRGRS